jgi:iduronate 2-sulfatase
VRRRTGALVYRDAVGAGAPPNVLYFTVDDLSATRLGAYGNPHVHTPNIDAFAERALLFERCYCQIGICGASRVSILTGIRPENAEIYGNSEQWRQLLPEAVSLVRLFRDSGYRTYGVGKINDPRNGPLDDAWTVDETSQGGVLDAEQSIAMLRRVATDRSAPFFLAIGTRQPHCPWNPTAEALAAYEPAAPPVEASGRSMDTTCGYEDTDLTEERAAELTTMHYADITDLDRTFGDVMREAERLDLLDNTIVIFWSGDHGYSLGQNGAWGKWTNYDVVTRIPLVMSVPGMRSEGMRSPALVEAVDVYPTLVELCRLPAPRQELDGVSFVPLLGDPHRPWKTAAFSVSAPFGKFHSIKTERYDFIWDISWWRKPELYDLERDPEETENLAPSSPELVAALREQLDAGPAAVKAALTVQA